MEDKEIFDKTKDILRNVLGIPQEQIIMEETRILDELGADSLDVVEIIMAIEDEFIIDIDDKDAERMETVKDIVDYIKVALN